MTNIADFTVITNRGEPLDLVEKQGSVLLVVNTASKCGFTPQYDGLEELHRRYGERGFEVLGFPCNQFGGQEPGDADEIAQFCKVNFGVSFPLMAKVDVNGPGASPLFDWLKGEARGVLGSKAIKWNFTKFLIDRDGTVVKRYGPSDKPAAIAADIEALL
ncbi:glutathione peroxidase [Qipengyuania sp. DY56-A-20]|jgi:glutathione peroxidase|uniref:Glutathione peroxidase n=1 Tax=Qipengyuania benthica TaxID=3067651 RepID=A0ABT9H899_9SPHN|nr:glutathione peroxidase [Qipengyuania sp. DY56-A-20]MBU1254708.1 glutathione peroxidase [Alphaproteobacteria bacterium]MDP4539539.1 glutathione peroxidase [Qipengyuania sp. DY56-A-20]